MSDDVLGRPPAAPVCARHPDRPAATTCAHCGNFACTDCDTLFEGRHVCATCLDEGRVRAASIPWADRASIGLIPAAWKTVLEVSGDPSGFFDRVRGGEPNLGDAMWFAFLVCIPAGIVGAFYNAAIFGLLLGPEGLDFLVDQFGEEARTIAKEASAGWVMSTLFGAITTPFIMVAWHLIAGLVHHLVLLVVGGAKRELEATLRTGMYALGVNLWAAIPVLGMFVSLWITVVKVIGYSRMHETEWWRGLVAVLAPGCLACCLFIGVFGMIFGFAAAAFGT